MRWACSVVSKRCRLEDVSAISRERGVCDLMAVSEQEIVLASRASPQSGAEAGSLLNLRGAERIVRDVLHHCGAFGFAVDTLFGVADFQIHPGTWVSLEVRDHCTGAETSNLVGRDVQ